MGRVHVTPVLCADLNGLSRIVLDCQCIIFESLCWVKVEHLYKFKEKRAWLSLFYKWKKLNSASKWRCHIFGFRSNVLPSTWDCLPTLPFFASRCFNPLPIYSYPQKTRTWKLSRMLLTWHLSGCLCQGHIEVCQPWLSELGREAIGPIPVSWGGVSFQRGHAKRWGWSQDQKSDWEDS